MGIDRRSFVQSLLLISTLIIGLSVGIVDAVPSGPTGEASFTMSLDRTEYKPGDTVIVRVDNSFYSTADALVTIRKAVSEDDSNTLQSYPDLEIVYNEMKNLVNNTVEFRYEIPHSVNNDSLFAQRTRYVVLLDDPSILFEEPDLSIYTPAKTAFFTVNSEGVVPFPFIFGIGAAIAGGIAFLTLRRRRSEPKA